MVKKSLIIMNIILSIMFLIFSIWFLFFDKNVYIKLKGNETINIDVFSEYIDEGATAYYKPRLLNGKKIKNVILDGNVNTSKVGKYVISYKANYNGSLINHKISVLEIKFKKALSIQNMLILIIIGLIHIEHF